MPACRYTPGCCVSLARLERVMAKIQSSSNGLFVALTFPRGEADDQNPVSLRDEFPGFRDDVSS